MNNDIYQLLLNNISKSILESEKTFEVILFQDRFQILLTCSGEYEGYVSENIFSLPILTKISYTVKYSIPCSGSQKQICLKAKKWNFASPYVEDATIVPSIKDNSNMHSNDFLYIARDRSFLDKILTLILEVVETKGFKEEFTNLELQRVKNELERHQKKVEECMEYRDQLQMITGD